MPAKRNRTGQRLSPQKEAQILSLLCAGKLLNEVATLTNSHWLTVRAVQWKHASSVDERKRILAERSENAAVDAIDMLHGKLLEHGQKLNTSALVPIFGVCVDKAIALRADPTIQIQHQHAHIHAHINECSFQELLANLPSQSDQPIPAIIDQPTTNDDR